MHDLVIRNGRIVDDTGRSSYDGPFGNRATLVAGEVTRENDAGTGAPPGRLLRRHR